MRAFFLASLLLLGHPGLHAQTFKVAATEWAPFTSATLAGQGISARILRAILAEQGHDMTIHFMPWSRALKDTAELRYDIVLPTFDTPERRTIYHYSKPFLDSPTGFFALRERHLRWHDLESLKGLRIAAVRSYINEEAFDASPMIDRTLTNSNSQSIELLVHGRVDLAVMDYYVGTYVINTLSPMAAPRLEFLSPALVNQPQHFSVSLRHPQGARLVNMLDEGIAKLQKNNQLKAFMDMEAVE